MARQQSDSVLLYSGVSAPTIEVQEGTVSGSYEIGDLVQFDTSGQIILAVAGNIAGIACMDATASAGSSTDVQQMEIIDFNALYLMTAAAATAAAQAHVGEDGDITYTYSAQYVTQDAGSAKEVLIYGIYPGDVDTNGGRYIVRFNPAVIELSA